MCMSLEVGTTVAALLLAAHVILEGHGLIPGQHVLTLIRDCRTVPATSAPQFPKGRLTKTHVPPAGAVFGGDATAMGFHDPRGDREAQTEAGDSARAAGLVRAVEALEDVRGRLRLLRVNRSGVARSK